MQGHVLIVEQHRSKRRRLVVSTFLGSVASLLFAITYDYIRPRLVHEVVPLLQHSLGLWKYFASSSSSSSSHNNNNNNGPFISSQMLILMLELLLVCPTVLAVLPFTRKITSSVLEDVVATSPSKTNGKAKNVNDSSSSDEDSKTTITHGKVFEQISKESDVTTKEDQQRQQQQLEVRSSGSLHQVLRILEGAAWLLWTLAAIVFFMGMLYTKMFGMISFSALLALFAQGIQAVKMIGSHRLDDDIDDEYYSNDDKVDHTTSTSDDKIAEDATDSSSSSFKRYNSDVLMPSNLVEENKPRPGIVRSRSHHASSNSSFKRRLSNDGQQGYRWDNAPRRRASSWAEDKRNKDEPISSKPKVGSEEDKEIVDKDVSSQSSKECTTTIGSTTRIKSGEKLDVFIFFLVSSCLLLSPYYLHVGIQFICKACWGCVHNSFNEGDNSNSSTLTTFLNMGTIESSSDRGIFERFNATINTIFPLLFGGDAHGDKEQQHDNVVDRGAPGEILAITAFVTTILIPIMTHGVGGAYFVGFRKGWDFYHPFRGGKYHVTTQALGWTLLFLAGLLQLLFLIKTKQRRRHNNDVDINDDGEDDDLSLYLWHGGSWLSMMAHGSLLSSILLFRQSDTFTTSTEEMEETASIIDEPAQKEPSSPQRSWFWFLISIVQDVILTNMHWFYAYWITSAAVGFDVFSLDPAANLFNIPFWMGLLNMLKTIAVWYLWTCLVPYSAHRKQWKYNIFGKINEFFEYAAFHPNGLFYDSQLRYEEPTLEHYHKCHRTDLVHDDDDDKDEKEGQVMFCIMPHGTLPTSVIAIWYQFGHFFDNVCCFFGSQVAMVPGYRYILAMRGGFMPVNKKQVVRIMKTRQSVSLVPGGVSEMMHCEAHSRQINVSIKHKGFVRLALQHGYDLVPLFFFHSNDQYDNPLKGFQSFTYKLCGIPVGLPWYTNKYRLPVSNRTPIRIVLGRRIIGPTTTMTKTNKGNSKDGTSTTTTTRKVREKIPDPTMEQIDDIHRKFYEEVYRIFEKYKHEFGYGDRELTYVS